MYVCEKCKWRRCMNTKHVCKYGLPQAKFESDVKEIKKAPSWREGLK